MRITVGQNPYAPYCAYGDDSAYNEVLLYSFIVCERHKIRILEKDIDRLKKMFGVPHDVPIHLKNLFNGIYREKNGIKNLELNRQPLFFRKVVDILNKNNCVVRYCYTVIPTTGSVLPDHLKDVDFQIVENHKAIIHGMASACFVPYLQEGKIVFTADMFETFLSHDSTLVKVFQNAPRKQAHSFAQLLIPLTFPARKDKYARLRPHIHMMKDNFMLQLADAVAYLLVHAMSSYGDQGYFTYQANRIKYCIKHKFCTEKNATELGVELPIQ